MSQEQDSEALFRELCSRFGIEPDRRGEAHVTCPMCGKEAERGQTHFSFSVRGGHCFVCNGKIGLRALYRQLVGDSSPSVRAPAPRRQVAKKREPVKFDMNAFGRKCVAHPSRVELWQAYKPVKKGRIDAYGLGVGTFPRYTSKCSHERLIVPILIGGIAAQSAVGFRGRSISAGCDCGKWLSPSGSQMSLYNGARIGDYRQYEGLGWAMGRRRVADVLFIVENPIDALLLEQMEPGIEAVATLGVSNWKDPWTAALIERRYSRVEVVFDNDRPGNGGGEAGRMAWLSKHDKDLEPNGVRLVNALLEAGIRAHLWDWEDAPLGADIGSMLVAA